MEKPAEPGTGTTKSIVPIAVSAVFRIILLLLPGFGLPGFQNPVAQPGRDLNFPLACRREHRPNGGFLPTKSMRDERPDEKGTVGESDVGLIFEDDVNIVFTNHDAGKYGAIKTYPGYRLREVGASLVREVSAFFTASGRLLFGTVTFRSRLQRKHRPGEAFLKAAPTISFLVQIRDLRGDPDVFVGGDVVTAPRHALEAVEEPGRLVRVFEAYLGAQGFDLAARDLGRYVV